MRASHRCACAHIAQLRLPDVLERQELSLNLLSKRVLSLILEKHLVVLESFSASLKILEFEKKKFIKIHLRLPEHLGYRESVYVPVNLLSRTANSYLRNSRCLDSQKAALDANRAIWFVLLILFFIIL